MLNVVLVNAAPGFEDAVEAALRKIDQVGGVGRVKKQNYDLAALVEAADQDELQRVLDSHIRRLSGVQGAEILEAPSEKLIEQLRQRAG